MNIRALRFTEASLPGYWSAKTGAFEFLCWPAQPQPGGPLYHWSISSTLGMNARGDCGSKEEAALQMRDQIDVWRLHMQAFLGGVP